MAHLIYGKQLQFGLLPVDFAVLESATPKVTGNWTEWQDESGKPCCAMLISEMAEVGFSGAMQLSDDGTAVKNGQLMGTFAAMFNLRWHTKPAAITPIVIDPSESRSNNGFSKLDGTLKIYPFAPGGEGNQGAVVDTTGMTASE